MNSNKRVFQVPPPLTMVDLLNNNDHHHPQLNSTSRSTKHILQKRVSLGSSGSSGTKFVNGQVRTISTQMMHNASQRKVDTTIKGSGECGKSKERGTEKAMSTLGSTNTTSHRVNQMTSNSNKESSEKRIDTIQSQNTMISPAKSTNALKAYQWQNVVASTSNKRKNSIHIFNTEESSKHQISTNASSSQQQIEMIRKKASHKRLATLSQSSINHNNNTHNNPPFSKNLILSQLVQNSNYQTQQQNQSSHKKANCTRNLETLLSSGGNRSNNCIFNTSNNKLIFRTSQDTVHFSKNLDSQQASPLLLATSHVKKSSRHFFGRKSNESSHTKERVKSIHNYQCETGASMDHKISPLLSQNSIVQNTSINCTQGAIVAQPTVTNRPQSNLAMPYNQGNFGVNIFNFTRPSFDQAGIRALNRSDRVEKPLITNYEEHFENVSSDDEDQISYKSSSPLNRDTSYMDERGFTTSQCDMVHTTGCSILEGATGIKLPISQIKTCALQLIMQPGQLLKQNSKPDIALGSSQKTTERNHKPFDRPQILNFPQAGLVVRNILAESRSPKRKSQAQRQRAQLQLKKHTKSTILDGTVQEISSTNLHQANKNKSRSTSPLSDVDAEYFCGGGGLNITGGSHRRIKKTEKSFEIMSIQSQSKWTLLDTYCKKGDIVSLVQLLQNDNKLLQDYKRNLLYKCLEYKQEEILKYILSQKNTEQYNLLHIALRPKPINKSEQDLSLFKVILKCDQSADLNAQDTYGNTPVHLAAQGGRIDVLRLFLRKKMVKLSIKNSEGKSAIEYAKDQEILKIFQDYITGLRSQQSQDAFDELRAIENDSAIQSRLKMMKKDKSQQSMKENQQKTINSKTSTSTFTPKALPNKQITFGYKKNSTLSTNQKCETEPAAVAGQYKKQKNILRSNMIFVDTEQICATSDKIINSFEQEQSLQICEQIEEVSEESLKNSLIKNVDSKIGPHQFEPLSLIGKGSFGEVYLVRKLDGTFDQLYAMKVLQKEKILGQNLVKYAITERNVLSITRHPFIVGLHYAFQTRDKLFLILEYCPGGDLGKVLEQEKRFDEARAKIYLAEILLALEDLHKRDIIFRDLKPDNVVLDAQGHALLTDFGLSKEGVLDNQAAKSFCGSVAYLAPEMLKRSGHGKSVDWYLLGVLLYEMLVGMPPYFNKDRDQLVSNIQKGPLLMPSQLSKEARDLIIALLCKNPLRRLGAGIRDAEEIKEHPFFKDIDWKKTSNRELTPPRPRINKIMFMDPSQKISYAQILAKDQRGKQENVLPGWSFAHPSNS